MNSTEGLALFLGLLLFAGSISFVYKWYMGSVNDAQGLFGVAGIAVSLVFPAFIAPELYRELFSGLRHLIVVPVGTAAAAAPLAVGEGAQQVLDATGRKAESLWGKFVGFFTGGGKRAKRRA
jgi:hypothetical protein